LHHSIFLCIHVTIKIEIQVFPIIVNSKWKLYSYTLHCTVRLYSSKPTLTNSCKIHLKNNINLHDTYFLYILHFKPSQKKLTEYNLVSIRCSSIICNHPRRQIEINGFHQLYKLGVMGLLICTSAAQCAWISHRMIDNEPYKFITGIFNVIRRMYCTLCL